MDIPLHVAMLSHLLIAWDRKRWLTDPLKVRLPAFVCSCASWLAGLVIALPYPIYTTYLDLEVSENWISLEALSTTAEAAGGKTSDGEGVSASVKVLPVVGMPKA
uniref:Uncharacterized protein n=1 Tax=Anopheles epiroticus TaxID=199890 RepID=A0A182PR16_9DIPT